MSGFCISLHKNHFEECLFNDVIPRTRENDLFTPFIPIKNEKKKSAAPLSAVETTRFTSRNHLWLHLIFNLLLAGRVFFFFFNDSMNSSFQSSTQTVISLSDVAPPPAQRLSALANPGYAAFVSDLFKMCLWIIRTRNPLILHLQVQKQCAHTRWTVHLSYMMDSF